MDADRHKWNQRFADKPLTPPAAPGFLVAAEAALAPGLTLDLASGDGAAALYLAGLGRAVTALDISAVALSRLQAFAAQRQLTLDTRELDLDDLRGLRDLGQFANLTLFHFKPSEALWQILPHLLRPGGKLLVSTFNQRHHQVNGFPQRFCLAPGELLKRHPALDLEHYQTLERGGAFMDDYQFVRR